MSQIITITLNPAIDKSTSVAELVPDKKLKCSLPVFQPGGGGVNVARAIKRLGADALALYLAGGYTGNFFTQLLEEEGVFSKAIGIRGHTRENLIVVEEKTKRQYRFGMPGPSVNKDEWKHLLLVLEEEKDVSYFVASGAVPAGIPDDIFARIASIAKKKKARFILDSSGEALKQGLEQGVFLIKPNFGKIVLMAG